MKRSIIAIALLSTMVLTNSTFAHADWSVNPYLVLVKHDYQWQSTEELRFSDGIDVYGLTHSNIDGFIVYIKTAYADLDLNDWMYREPGNSWRTDLDFAGLTSSLGHGVNIYAGIKETNPIENEYYSYDEPFANVLWRVQSLPEMYNWRFDLR